MRAHRQLIVVGAGEVGRAVKAGLPEGWAVRFVDVHPTTAQGVDDVVVGDGTSRLVLQRAGVGPGTPVVAATGDEAVNLEVVRVAAELGAEEVVPVVHHAGVGAEGAVVRATAVAAQVLNRVVPGAVRGAGVGLGQGDVVEVTVLPGSAAIGRPLREIAASHWLVAAVYRSGALIIPHGATAVQADDRVLLVGEPDSLRAVASFFHGGAPVFPLQYGAMVGCLGPAEAAARQLVEVTGAQEAVAVDPAWIDPSRTAGADAAARLERLRIGCLVIPPPRMPWHVRWGLSASAEAELLVAVDVPVLVARAPRWERVVLAVRERQREVALAAFDLARQLRVPLAALVVDDPVRGGDVAATQADLAAMARLYGVTVHATTERDNPVHALVAASKPGDLFVVGHRPPRRSVFEPDVSVQLLHRMPVSTLFVPWGEG